jgi:shikimate kinase
MYEQLLPSGAAAVTSSHVFAVVCLCCRYAFFDTDNVIEMAHPGESVSDIFKKYGEDYFRNCESQVRRM